MEEATGDEGAGSACSCLLFCGVGVEVNIGVSIGDESAGRFLDASSRVTCGRKWGMIRSAPSLRSSDLK